MIALKKGIALLALPLLISSCSQVIEQTVVVTDVNYVTVHETNYITTGINNDVYLEDFYDECDYDNSGRNYNKNLFYKNGINLPIADPCVIKITDINSPYFGKYFCYGTRNNYGIEGFISSDLVNFESVGFVLYSDQETSDTYRILTNDVFAPEVVYDKVNKKYYMYFSSTPSGSETSHLGFVATSTSPNGPFTLCEHSDYKSKTGGELTAYYLKYSIFDPYKFYQALISKGIINSEDKNYNNYLSNSDFSIFENDDGEKYLIFTRNNAFDNRILCIPMTNYLSLDYDSLTTLAVPDLVAPGSIERCEYETESNTLSSPSITKIDNKYYLTMSIGSSINKKYSVIQAVADKPFGVYRKVSREDGGVLLTSNYRNDVSGTASSSIIKVGDEYYIIYQAHDDVKNGGLYTHYAIDSLSTIYASNTKEKVLFANGPTTNMQLKPLQNSRNLAKTATVSATNLKNTSKVEQLIDGIIPINRNVNASIAQMNLKEVEFTSNTTITINLPSESYIDSIAVYNSPSLSNAFSKIKKITLTKFNDDGSRIRHEYNDIKFDLKDNMIENEFLPSSIAACEFSKVAARRIVIEIDEADILDIKQHNNANSALGISEIKILGENKEGQE